VASVRGPLRAVSLGLCQRDPIRHRERLRAWLTGIHAGPDRALNIPCGTVCDRLLAGPSVATRAVSGCARDSSISTLLAPLLIPFANAATGSAVSLRVASSWRGGHFAHHAKRDRVRQADERAAAGMTSVRGPAAAWRCGISYIAAGCIWCRRD